MTKFSDVNKTNRIFCIDFVLHLLFTEFARKSVQQIKKKVIYLLVPGICLFHFLRILCLKYICD